MYVYLVMKNIKRLLDRIGISEQFVGKDKANLCEKLINEYVEQQIQSESDKGTNQKLQSKSFATKLILIDWVNSEDGTDYIISIVFHPRECNWTVFYIK